METRSTPRKSARVADDGLRVRGEVLHQDDLHVRRAESLPPSSAVRRVAGRLEELRVRVEGSEEIFVHRDHPVPLLVVVQGDEASHRLAEGDDDSALWVDRRDSLGGLGSVEIRGSDLTGSGVFGDLAEVRGVPLEPLLVVAVEEERLLQLGRDHRVGASREVLVEPRRPGSLRTDEHEAQPESSLPRRVNEALGHQTCDRRSPTARSEVS